MKHISLLIILLISSFSYLPAQNELFENNSFEDWSGSEVFGYSPQEWNTTMGSTFKETAIKKSGNLALKIATSNQSSNKLEQEIRSSQNQFFTGDVYEITINYYVTKSQDGNDILLKSYWTNGGAELSHDSDKLNNGTYLTSVGQWATKTIQTSVPENATSFYFALNVTKGSDVIFDDFSFKKIERTEPYINITPATLPKVSTLIGSPVQMAKLLISSGNLPNPITLEVTGKDAGYFTPSISSIPVSENLTEVTITYNPLAAGSHSAMLLIDCAGAEILSKTVSLKGDATDPTQAPIISVSPTTSLTFEAEVGKESVQEVYVTSSDLTDYLYAKVQGEADGVFLISTTMLPKVNDNTPFRITFKPKVQGTFTKSIELYSKGAQSVVIKVSGTGKPKGGGGEEPEGDKWPLDPNNPLALLIEPFNGVTHNKVLSNEGWKNIAEVNTRAWWGYTFKNDNGAITESTAKVTAFNSVNTDEVPYEMWLVTPPLDFVNSISKMFTFRVMGDLMIANSDAVLELYYMDMADGYLYKQKIDMDMPSIPDDNKEWREFHIDLTGQNISDTFFMGFRFSATGGLANSAVYYIDDVTYGRTDIPQITASEDYIFLKTRPDVEIQSKVINVSSTNLNNPVTLSIGGSNASKFELSTDVLPSTGGNFTVSFKSDLIGIHVAYVKLSSRGAADVYIPISAETSNDLSIKDNEVSERIYVKDNYIYIESETKSEVSVYNISGKIIGNFSALTREYQIPVYLHKGIYIVKVSVDNKTDKYHKVIIP